MKNNDNTISYEEREHLREFFLSVYDWMLNHLNPTNEDIKEFTKFYEEYLNKNNLRGNKILNMFLLELKCDQLISKKKMGPLRKRVIALDEKIPKSPLFMQNSTIVKWYRESKLERRIFTNYDSFNESKKRSI